DLQRLVDAEEVRHPLEEVARDDPDLPGLPLIEGGLRRAPEEGSRLAGRQPPRLGDIERRSQGRRGVNGEICGRLFLGWAHSQLHTEEFEECYSIWRVKARTSRAMTGDSATDGVGRAPLKGGGGREG